MKTRIASTLAILLVVFLCSNMAQAENDLLLHLPFDELSADGTTTPDASGHGHHVKLHGQTLVDGVAGKALHFDGFPGQMVELGNLKCRAPATVVIWFKTRDLVNDRRLLSQAEGPATQTGMLRLMGQVEVGGLDWVGLVTHGLRHNTWTHLAVVFSADGRATGYLNGQAQEPVKAGFDFDGVSATLGGRFLGQHGAEFTGDLDDFRLYGRALSAEEIGNLFRQHVPK